MGNEEKFWTEVAMIDPISVAPWLYLVSGDVKSGEAIIQAQH